MEDSAIARLRPLSSSTKRSSQIYKTIASDDLELKTNSEPSSDRDHRSPAHGSFQPAHWLSRIQSFWKDTWIDVRSLPWSRFSFHTMLLFMVLGLIALIVLMTVSPDIFTIDDGDFCKPDGSFDFSFHQYTPWKRDVAFAINMKFGSYDFGVAKLIDICWDVGIGRGGQAFLAFISYRIFTKALTRTMEASSVSHDTFRAVTLQNDTTTGTAILIKDFFKTSGRRAKAAVFWTILAGSFVILVPTWLSAMTGYTADIQSFVLDREDNLVSASKFRPVVYIIHDGARLGDDRKNDTRFAVPWLPRGSQLEDGCNSFSCGHSVARFNETGDGFIEFNAASFGAGYFGFPPDMGIDCKWMWAISKYVSDYGFLGATSNLNTFFHQPSDNSNVTTRSIFNPPLNVSAHFLLSPISIDEFALSASNRDWNICPFGRSWQNPHDNQYPFEKSNPMLWDDGSDTSYNSVEAFNRNGSCQQSGRIKYQWGFSFLLLFTFVVTFLIWTIGMWALYIDSWLHSRLDVSQRYMGMERAVLDISESILSRVEGDDIKLYGNRQLQALAAPNMLTFTDLQIDSHIVTRWTEYKRWWRHEFNFKRWIRDEKWWLCAMLFFDVMLILSWMTPVTAVWMPYAAFFPGFGVFMVLLLGRAVKGRWAVFALWFLIFFIADCWWISWYFGLESS